MLTAAVSLVHWREVAPQHLKPNFPSLHFQTSVQNTVGQGYEAHQLPPWPQVPATPKNAYTNNPGQNQDKETNY